MIPGKRVLHAHTSSCGERRVSRRGGPPIGLQAVGGTQARWYRRIPIENSNSNFNKINNVVNTDTILNSDFLGVIMQFSFVSVAIDL